MSFNGLWNAAQQQLGEDPKSGALFAFTNRRRNRIKIIYFDGTGVIVLAKRLEQGRFTWPASDNVSATLRGEELIALLAGLVVREKADVEDQHRPPSGDITGVRVEVALLCTQQVAPNDQVTSRQGGEGRLPSRRHENRLFSGASGDNLYSFTGFVRHD